MTLARPHSNSSWGPSVQIHKPEGGHSFSNHNTNQVGVMSVYSFSSLKYIKVSSDKLVMIFIVSLYMRDNGGRQS